MKKSTFKKVVVMVLALCMAFAMAACGSKDEPKTEAKLVIGGIGPTTGGAAVYGLAVKQGAEIAVEEINAKGGLQIEYMFEDDTHDAEVAVNAYNKLMDKKMQLLMGTVTSSPCVAVSAKTYKDRVFELTPSASAPAVTEGKDNVFQMCFTDPNQGKTAADYISANMSGKKVGVIYNSSDAYSTGIVDGFKAEAAVVGLSVVAYEAFPSDDTANFDTQIKACMNAGADLVFLPIYYTPASLILSQSKALNYAPLFFGCDGLDGILALENFDLSLAEGVYLITPFNPWTTGKDFADKYQAKYGEMPNQFAADAYDCIYALYNAFQESGCTADMSAADICDKMVPYFTGSFKVTGLTGADMAWAKNGEVSKAPIVAVIKDSAYADL
ncbi:MAG: ABC transporter substrate-binding protein [Clostridia bacterium]|nr:ABC transporter substrate-binding protein [Clostridia bacterium]